MSTLSLVNSNRKVERRSIDPEYPTGIQQIKLEKQMSENFDLAFVGFCVAGLIGAMIGFATGAIPLIPDQS